MTTKIKKLSLGVVFLAVITAMMMLVAVADYSGTDTNISWNIDVSEGVLTVSGGAMPVYANGDAPWYQYKSGIKTIVVNSGVTISKGAFYGMENLNKISVPYVGDGSANTYFGYIFGASNYFQNEKYVPTGLKTVEITGSTTIASYAFNNVSSVEKIVLADTVTTIDTYAFKDCASLKYMVLGSGVKTIGANAFQRCNSIVYTFFNGTSTGWSQVTVDSTNTIAPIFLGGGDLTVVAPSKTEYTLGEKFDITGFSAKFGANDVTDAVEIDVPDMTTVGVKTVEVVFGIEKAQFNVSVAALGTSGVSGVITWAVDVDEGTLAISGNGMMDNYTLEITAPWYIYRDSIKTVTVAEGVTSVGAYAFYGLDNVTSITLPETIESVDYGAFENCSALTTLTLGNTAAKVDGTAFKNCIGLMVQSNGATYAKVSGNANYALISVDASATSFTIPATTAVIGAGAFENSAVTSITVPASVISIGDNAFASCASLASVTLGAGVKLIGNYAFVDCAALKTVTFNAVPDFVGTGAFAATAITGTVSNGAEYLGTADNAYAILWKAADTSITSCAVNTNTKVIASLAFVNCNELEAVELPEGLLHIGDSAFNACSSLYSIQIPSTVVTIGDNAFKNCSALTAVTLSDSVKVIGNDAFRGASKITEIVIGANVENVGYNAFRDCTSLKTVVFNAYSVGYKAFANCTSLSKVYLADSVVSLGEYAFAGCTALTAIAVPDTTSAIGYGAFYGDSAITEIALPFVGEKANDTDGSLAYIFGENVPATLNTVIVGSIIPDGAFKGTAVTNFIIDKTVGSIGATAFDTTPANVYYLGSESEWANVVKGTNFSNVAFANSEFELESFKKTYEMGEVLDSADFAAALIDLDVTSLLRFVSNPVTSDAVVLPAKIGSISQMFLAKTIDELQFTNYSLLLEGSIGVKFYIKLSDYVINGLDGVSAKIDYYGETYDVELVKAENTVDSTIYTVKFYVAAKEMDQPITLTVTTPNTSESVTKTVKDYVEYVNANASEYSDCITLINEMYNYGEYSRQYFLKADITPNPDLTDVEVTISDSYTPVRKGSVTGVTFEGSSLLLESNTTVRHYFALADGASVSDYTFAVNGAKVTPAEKDGLYYIEVDNIIARSLGKLDKAVISTATETMVITYSPMSYVKLVLEKHATEDPVLVNVVKALYRYYVAASDYFEGVTDEIETSEDESKPSIW